MLPDLHSEEQSTSIVDYSYNLYSPTKYPDHARKGKRVVKKEEAEKNPMTEAIKQEPTRKTFHEFPPIVENREIMEVQVLEEGEMFDPDIFLEGLTQHYQTNRLVLLNLYKPLQEYVTTNPREHRDPVVLSQSPQWFVGEEETDTQYGHWKYYKCPIQSYFVCLGVDHVEYYLDSGKRQLQKYGWQSWLCIQLFLLPILQVIATATSQETFFFMEGAN